MAKLLEMSGSDTTAKEECDEVEEMVRPREEARGSSCHAELAVSTAAYKRPYEARFNKCPINETTPETTLTVAGCPRTPATK